MKKTKLIVGLVGLMTLVGLTGCGPASPSDSNTGNSSIDSATSEIQTPTFSKNISEKEKEILLKIVNEGNFEKVAYQGSEILHSKFEVKQNGVLKYVIYQAKAKTSFIPEGFDVYVGVDINTFLIQGIQYDGKLTTHDQDDLFKDNDLGMTGTDGSSFDTVAGSTFTCKAINDAAKAAVKAAKTEYGKDIKPDVPEKQEFTITFDLNGGTGNFDAIKVESGKPLPRPTSDPVKENYNFIGWYIKDTEIKYDFNQPVTKDINLIAHWQSSYIFFRGEILRAPSVDKNGKIVIPSEIDGQEVISLGDSLFKNNTQLKEIVIPNSVKEIKFSAFEGCTSLTKISIESTLDSEGNVIKDLMFGNNLFKGCTALAEFNVPERVTTLGMGTFENCTGLKTITFKTNINISDSLFKGCSSLNTVTFAKDKSFKIGKNSFEGNTSLSNLVNFEYVNELDQEALLNCTGISQLNFGKDFNRLGIRALKGTKNLRTINIDEENTNFAIVNNALYNKSLSSLKYVCPTNETTFTFPKKTTSFDATVFDDLENLEAFEVEEGNTKYVARVGLLFEKPSWGQDINLKAIPTGFKGDIVLQDNERYKTSLHLGLIKGLNSFTVGSKDESMFTKIDGALYTSRKNYSTNEYYPEELLFVDKSVKGTLILPETVSRINEYPLAYSNVDTLVITNELVENTNKQSIDVKETSFAFVGEDFKIYVPEGYYNTYSLQWGLEYNGNPLGLKYLQEDVYVAPTPTEPEA